MSQQKITVGVVGLGGIARKAHLPVLAAHPGAEVVGLCSRSGAQVEPLAAQYRFRLQARTLQELLAVKPRAAYVLSATEAHPEHALQLLEAGIAVYLEKPLANRLQEARAIAAKASEPGAPLLLVGFNRRYAPAYRRARELFAGRLPEYVYLQKHRQGGHEDWELRRLVMDDAIHIIDLARFFAGGLQVRSAKSAGHLVAAQLTAPSTLVQLSQSRGAGQATERVELHGGGLSVVVEDMQRLVIREGGRERVETVAGPWTPTLTVRGMQGATEHFLACLRGEGAPETTAAEALATQELAEAILEAGV